MKIVVIGGTGLIGTKLVGKLRQRGREVVAASPATGVNTITGEGLDNALAGTDVVVDVANSPSFEDQAVLDFFRTAGRNLIAAEQKAGVKHHVALSVVGTDRLLASGYFRGKMAQEDLISASPVPFTIVRATQFFEFMGTIVQSGGDGHTLHLPDGPMQPMAADDVAEALVDVALGAPASGIREIAGPDRRPLAAFVEDWLRAKSDPRTVEADPAATYFGVALDDRSLTPDADARIMPTHFAQWLAAQAG